MRLGQESRVGRGMTRHVRRPGFDPASTGRMAAPLEPPAAGSQVKPAAYRIVRVDGSWMVEFRHPGGGGSSS